MSSPLPAKINLIKLAERHAELEGVVLIDKLQRLHDIVCGEQTELLVSMRCYKHAAGFLAVEGQINGKLQLTCQRCMQAMSHDVSTKFSIGVCQNMERADKLRSGFEPYLLEDASQLMLWELIEDELIIQIDAYPSHAIGLCDIPKLVLSDVEIEIEQAPQQQRENPFAMLKQFKSSK